MPVWQVDADELLDHVGGDGATRLPDSRFASVRYDYAVVTPQSKYPSNSTMRVQRNHGKQKRMTHTV